MSHPQARTPIRPLDLADIDDQLTEVNYAGSARDVISDSCKLGSGILKGPVTVRAKRGKWQQACEFYEQDLQSGFVRLMMELMAASFSDEALRREFVPRLVAWFQVVEAAVGDAIDGYGLELPVSRSAITGWIVSFWVGMEAHMTLGITDKQGHFRAALQGVAELLRRVEAQQAPPRRSSRSRK